MENTIFCNRGTKSPSYTWEAWEGKLFSALLMVLGLIQSTQKSGVPVCFYILYLCFVVYVLGILIITLIHTAYWNIWIKGELCKRITLCNLIVFKLFCYWERGKQPWSVSLFALIHYTVLVIVLNSVSWILEFRPWDALSQVTSVHYRAALVLVEAPGMSRMQVFFTIMI